jgi:glycosyltransferase involved in cell wall biosynthesis
MGADVGLAAPPRVSVVVPTRNRRRLLRQLLDALADQTLTDHEVIVVDDGSTDGSGEEVEADARAGRPVRLLHGGGGGAVNARRAAVDVAFGEFLAFTDDDCVPHRDWLAAGVAALETGADVVQGVTRAGGAVRPLDRTIMVDRHDGLYNTCNVFYRSEAYRAAGGFETSADTVFGFRPSRAAKNLGFGEDALLGWRVRRAGGAAFAPDAVVEHHVFPPDPRDAIRRAWMTGAFPGLVRQIPELRQTALAHRFFLGTTRIPLYAAVGLAVLGHRRAALSLAGCWVARHARSIGRESSPKRFAAGLVGELAIDGTIAAALVTGSVRARTVVL